MTPAKLGDGWHWIHAVPVGENGSDIDHVVIGPAGVFTLNAKRHPGRKAWIAEWAVMVNGNKTDYLRNSRFEAARASTSLSSACGFSTTLEACGRIRRPQRLHREPDAQGRPRCDTDETRGLAAVPACNARPGDGRTVFAKARLSTTWQPASS
jgi:hypothetical protein